MTIEFNSTMSTNFNFSLINKTTVNIYIDPQIDDDLTIKDRLRSNLNLTWELVDFKSQQMLIQVNFSDPIEISPLQVQDLIVVHIMNLTHPWFCKDIGLFLHSDFHVLKAKVKKQNYNNKHLKEAY